MNKLLTRHQITVHIPSQGDLGPIQNNDELIKYHHFNALALHESPLISIHHFEIKNRARTLTEGAVSLMPHPMFHSENWQFSPSSLSTKRVPR